LYDTGGVKPQFPQLFDTFHEPSTGSAQPGWVTLGTNRRGVPVPDEVELAVLTASFDARDGSEDALAGALARYVVLARTEDGCRNIDLVTSTTQRGRFLVIEKWGSRDAARAHLDGAAMTDMARAAVPLLAAKPTIDLHDTISAHDLA
jgi:quinol monooxygenase YgiN